MTESGVRMLTDSLCVLNAADVMRPSWMSVEAIPRTSQTSSLISADGAAMAGLPG